jgi:hypothetical protein
MRSAITEAFHDIINFNHSRLLRRYSSFLNSLVVLLTRLCQELKPFHCSYKMVKVLSLFFDESCMFNYTLMKMTCDYKVSNWSFVFHVLMRIVLTASVGCSGR